MSESIHESKLDPHDKSILATDIDPKHISSSTKKEKEEANRLGFQDADLPPGDFGMPFTGEGLKMIGKDGFEFFRLKCEKEGQGSESGWAPLVKTHLFGERAICICGVEEAKLFYDTAKVTRIGALTPHLKKYFFGDETMINLEGEEHRHRKMKLLESFSAAALQRYMVLYGKLLEKYMNRWTQQEGSINIRDEMMRLHTEFGMIAYLGVSELPQNILDKRAKQLNYIIESFGSVPLPVELPGTRASKAGKARRDLESWMLGLIRETKQKLMNGAPPGDTFIDKNVFNTDLEGNPIQEEVFAAELINLLRPTTLAAYYMVFLMHAIHENHQILDAIKNEVAKTIGADGFNQNHAYYSDLAFLNRLDYTDCCAQEIRRFYPCIPLLVARVKEPFEYHGIFFPRDYLLFLGVHAVHRDPRVWTNPDTFDPLRFAEGRKEHCKYDERFAVVQQGGGDLIENHKCAGIQLSSLMIKSFASRMAVDYQWKFVEKQDFTYSTRVMPTLPKDGILIEKFEQQHQA